MPVDGFLDGTAHFGRSSFHCTVTPLHYFVPGWSICARKQQVNFQFTCECSEFAAAEG